MYGITYFGPNCAQYFALKESGVIVNGSRIDNCPSMGQSYHISFGEYVKKHFPDVKREFPDGLPKPGQAWFLLPLFVFSQLLAHLFTLWHPSHSQATSEGLPCCGRSVCCTRPFSCCAKFFSCISCFGKPASTPVELVNSTVSWLGTWYKLGLLPATVFGLFGVLFVLLVGLGVVNFGIYTLLYFFVDPAYPLMLFFGYTITAADDVIKDCLRKGRWIYFIVGVTLATLCSVFTSGIIPVTQIYQYVPLAFFNGFSKWLVIIGIYGVTRNAVKSSHRYLEYLSSIAMPFYLTHQQVLVAILSGVLWVPYLGSFPVVLILATLASGLVSHVITKLTNFRYLFGLKPANDSFLPGKKLRGFIPVICLAIWAIPVIWLINRSY